MTKKILIAYYSRRGENYCNGEIRDLKIGNTELVAKKIDSLTTADMFQIQTVKTYPVSYMETTEVAKKELRENARPALTESVKNMQEYDTIILGYPSWWGTMPMAVFTFLEQYDFSDKTIIPFCTNEGSGLGSSIRDLKKLCPKANILSGLSIHGTQASQADSQAQQIANMAM